MHRILKSRKRLLLAGLGVLAVAVGIGWWLWDSPERRIRHVLRDGEAAVEAEDLERAMSHVSLHYRDAWGLTHLGVRRLLERTFETFDGFRVRFTRVRLEVREERARVRGDLEVLVRFQGQWAYLVGRPGAPNAVTLFLAKEGRRWRVRRVDGIRMPLDLPAPQGRPPGHTGPRRERPSG